LAPPAADAFFATGRFFAALAFVFTAALFALLFSAAAFALGALAPRPLPALEKCFCIGSK
jgi:hypothetical protein